MWLLQFLANWRPEAVGLASDGIIDTAFAIQTRSLEPRAPATALEISSSVAVLRRTPVKSASSLALLSHVVSGAVTELQTISGGAGYGIDVGLGNTEVLLSVDTGSSDTWVVSQQLQCVGPRGNRVPNSYCNFGPLFNGEVEAMPDQNFNVSYGSGEFVTGSLGYTDVTIANVTISHQEVALVDEAYWQGDNETSGLLGLGFRSLTSSYQGTDSTKDSSHTLVGYSPIVESSMNQGLFSMFSLALQRGADDVWGYLALGGLPPVDIQRSFVSTPILLTNLSAIGRNSSVYSFYAIRPDGFSLSGGLLAGFGNRFWRNFFKSSFPVIIDSGTTLNYLPYALAARVNALFDPPAEFVPWLGGFEVACNAKAPNFAVRINGVDMAINSQDMIIRGVGGQDPDTGLCVSTIQPSGQSTYILGDAFLKNVVAVFDVGAAQMRFASRSSY